MSFFFQAEDGIRDSSVTGVQTCALPIYRDQKQGGLARWRGSVDDDRDERAQSIADQSTDGTDQGRLYQELAHDVDRCRADGLLEADLADAFGDGHEHRVDDRQAADDEREQSRRGRDGGEDGAAGFEAVDDYAWPGRLDAGNLRIDAVRDRVQPADRRPRLGIDVDRLCDLRRVDLAPDGDRQAVLEQHLPVGDVDVGERVGCGARDIEDADHRAGVARAGGLG